MAKLTDKQKKLIIAEYALCQNYSTVASKFGVNKTTVMRCVKSNPVAQQKATLKKEQNTLDMLAYLDSKKNKAQEIITNVLDSITKEDIKSASLQARMTVAGVLIDKFTGISNTSPEDNKAVININFKDCTGKTDADV